MIVNMQNKAKILQSFQGLGVRTTQLGGQPSWGGGGKSRDVIASIGYRTF